MARSQQMQMPRVQYNITRLGGGQTQQGVSFPGGLDLTTPSLALQPGALRACLNFEVSQSGGYARIQGYERYSGQTPPSSATYEILQVTSFSNVPTVGQVLTQHTTGASGTIIAVNNAAGACYMALTNGMGSFNATDPVFIMDGILTVTSANPQTITASNPLTITDTLVGTATTTTVVITSLVNAQYTAAAADVYRALIAPVPGSGPILGVVGMTFNGEDYVYAFRADNTNSYVHIYVSSPTGWAQIPLFNTVNFTGGSAAPVDGDTITQGGVTATIQRTMWQSGTYAGSTAVGTLVVTNPAGGNFTSGAATTSSGGAITLSGAQVPITILPGGKYEFVKCNFSGQLVTRRIYGCDGANKCFEFDGTTYAPITTGFSPDVPSHICFHKNYLFISQASSLIYCGVGTPFKWDSTDGGGEITTGDTVTDMLTLPGSQTTATLGIYLRSNTAFLYGLDPTTFNYVTFNSGIGALPYSAQNLYDTFAFDSLGVINLKTTLNWGNFLPTTLTKNILPFILQERGKLVDSSINRSKSQYRAFFSDGYGLWVTMVNQQYLGSGVVQFPNPVNCVDETSTSNGGEASYFGSNDGLGYVYQLDTGPSFDGAALPAYVTLAWDAIKTPRILKRFRAASIEIQSSTYAQISFGYALGYGSPNIGQPTTVSYSSNFSGVPYWDSFTWDNFTWDGQTLLPTDVDMTGTAENVQVTLSSGTNYIGAFNLNSVIQHFTPRRGIRV